MKKTDAKATRRKHKPPTEAQQTGYTAHFEKVLWPFFLAGTTDMRAIATEEEAANLDKSLEAVHEQIVQLCERM